MLPRTAVMQGRQCTSAHRRLCTSAHRRPCAPTHRRPCAPTHRLLCASRVAGQVARWSPTPSRIAATRPRTR
ncbi:MAG TPA: hypothetical protein DEG88_07400 [Propionibacteriaceae bacterium]|nr:hypothetical protein [Propionibacteriaceae bacterium]HBY23102.1 hypothetical protein [Propionibacteriaceae bacterium]